MISTSIFLLSNSDSNSEFSLFYCLTLIDSTALTVGKLYPCCCSTFLPISLQVDLTGTKEPSATERGQHPCLSLHPPSHSSKHHCSRKWKGMCNSSRGRKSHKTCFRRVTVWGCMTLITRAFLVMVQSTSTFFFPHSDVQGRSTLFSNKQKYRHFFLSFLF